MRRAGTVAVCAVFVALASVAGAWGEDARLDPPGRPRIGLVLSGGGARGIAHIGVLRALEALHVPIDAIAGTSMGAVVGGLYASGLSPEEIERAFRDIDWSTAFDDSTARDRLSFRRKQDDLGVLFNFQVGLRGGRLRVPRGLVQGQKFNLILRRLMLPVATVRDFDQLPIPFRAVAADLGTGEQVVMGSGDLVLALRASMAVPGVFSPVEREGRHLVDGSIADNLPIDVARTMGVDRLIVVDISEPLGTAASLDSPVAITNQVFTLLIRKTTEERKRSLGSDDLLIVPEMEVGSAQFERIDRAIDGGREAVEKEADRFSALALSVPEYGQWAARLQERRGGDAEAIRHGGPRIAQIEIRSDSRRTDELIRRRMTTRPGERLKIDALTSDLERLYGTGVFDQLGFELEEVEGETVLGIDAKSRSWGPNYLRSGLNLRDDFRGSTGFDLGLRYTATGFGRLGAESRTDVRLGENQSIETELYQPFGAGRWFVAPRLGLSRRNLTIAEGETELASFRVGSAFAGFDLGREVSDWGELRLGVEVERLRAAPSGGSDGPVVRARDGRAFARLTVDRLDDASFPRRGFAGSFLLSRSFPELGADQSASRVSIDSQLARSLGAYTLVGGLELGYSFEEGLLFPPYSLGGLFSLSGYRPGEFPGDRIALGRLIGYRQFVTLGQKLYLGASFEAGKTRSERSDLGTGPLRLSGSLFAGVRTYFGPIYLAYGLGEHQRRNYYFYLGRTF